MTKNEDFSPIRIGGYDIEVTLTADHFWLWERTAEVARDNIRSDPARAFKLLDDLSKEMGQRHALARKDDETLPGYYRQFLGQ